MTSTESKNEGFRVGQEKFAKWDAATKEATAFTGWHDMLQAMIDGYIPTLRDDYGSRKFRNAIRVLREACQECGKAYCDGFKVVGGN